MRINVLTLVVYFTFAVASFAQSDLITIRQPRPPEPVKFDYDKFQDTTYARGEEFWITPLGRASILFNSVQLVAGFSHPGPKLLKPVEYFFMSFDVSSKEWRFLERTRREVIILADGIRMPFSVKEHDGRTSRFGGSLSTVELLSFVVDRADFRTMAHAKSVEIQIGGILEMKLDEKQKFMLNQLLDAGTLK
jgi:hypothetical protein